MYSKYKQGFVSVSNHQMDIYQDSRTLLKSTDFLIYEVNFLAEFKANRLCI